jgi:hypothetical protein
MFFGKRKCVREAEDRARLGDLCKQNKHGEVSVECCCIESLLLESSFRCSIKSTDDHKEQKN